MLARMTTARHPLLHAGPSVGFDQPFEMLAACHARMERSLDLLERLGRHLHDQGCDAQARSAAADVLRYFDIAAPLHHQDEELHLLPLLRAQGQAGLAARLRADHQVMEHDWARLRPDLLAIASGSLDAQVLAGAVARWTQFAALYRRHLAAEEARAFPAAGSGLTPPQLQAMGEEMAARRGAAPRR
ncbi:hemerythrin-like domain-containing protein [Pseudorhodoferax soli]|jgi:hemerythrin-like domain-containing protein|uniref:Hemerythrin-like domain-containing protein n=2 Tax=Pseudorhodoferax soli TaxID=545864 RepID=A0A368XYA5_9BURK|nr:hemerythrin-like domain-containing protein [Pseudorhodoferax soli]